MERPLRRPQRRFRISRFDTTQFSTRIAAEVKDFDPLQWFEKKDVKKMD